MNSMSRRLVIGAAAVSMTLSLAACGGGHSSSSGNQAIGLLLPERASSTRYEAFDKPLIETAVSGLCTKCTIDYANADGDEQAQKKQFDALLARNVKVILLDPVNAAATAPWIDEAAKKGTKVIAYDRLAAGKVSAYISFDNQRTGELQGRALLDALGSRASGAEIVMINGAETDPNAGDFKAGAHHALDGKVKRIAYEQSGEWKPEVAAARMNEAMNKLGKNGFQAVYSANDGMAGAIIDELHKAGRTDVPVGGQDASLDAVRRILTGEQAYTIYKPYQPEAEAAADMAVYLVKGIDLTSVASATTESNGLQIPSMLLSPVVVTKAKVAETIVAGGLYKAEEICTPQFAQACHAANIPGNY
ncbi:sugar ABC transporter substrate-binding protein [Kitasatospora sp. CB01950]|uniref:sugar ABC transporter substrate-binding protein n=1 Tax=Kitasatospora sp. CB01950 TaxID=1703930 RepID=UPI0009397D43|nr:substrate-binding domain-containing protein [Kitasatospora sp. CB01950]OKJ16060.1 ABC transporter substrate-binding protein [Kitasatospora sp. CB01950]